jgi:hypothetical protein
MDMISNILENKDKVTRVINKFGCSPEHNLHHFLNFDRHEKVFISFGNSRGIFASFNRSSHTWFIFPRCIFCDEKEKINLLLAFADNCLYEKSARKIWIELEEYLYRDLVDKFKENPNYNIEICRINKTYYWPVINLMLWDKELQGKKWQKIRQTLNKFHKNSKVELIEACDVPQNELKKIVREWENRRNSKDRAYILQYLNLIEKRFGWTDYSMAMLIDKQPAAIMAGWEIPNSKDFYLSVMLHDYSKDRIGEVIYIKTLNHLKGMGFQSVELGGCDDALLSFKQKFHPSRIYKTYEFSFVAKR